MRISLNKNLFKILNREESIKLFFLSLGHLIGSFFDLLSFGLIVPVLYLVNDEKAIEFFEKLSYLPKISNDNTQLDFLLYLLMALFIFNLLKISYLIGYSFIKNKFAYNLRKTYSVKITSNFLDYDYEYFLKTNSSKIIRTSLTDVDNFVSFYVIPLAEIISDVFLLLILISVSLFFQLQITLIIVSFLFIYLFIIIKVLSKKGYAYGIIRNSLFTKSFKILQETIGAIKEIKIYESKKYFTNKFSLNYSSFINYGLKHILLVDLPRFFLEIIIFIIMIIIVLFLIIQENSLMIILTNIGVFSLISIRLMPILTKLQSNL